MTRHTDRKGMSRAYRARHIFHPYYALLNQLAAGEVDATEAGEPVVQFEGQIEAAAPVLHGFVACWQRVEARRRVGADLPALTALAHKLEQGQPITPAELATARHALDACLRAYKRLPLTLIADAANLVEIEAKFEGMGLIETEEAAA
jgi:hypothetical protein